MSGLLALPYSLAVVAELGLAVPQVGDGTWIQRGLPHTYDHTAPTAEVSVAAGGLSVGATRLFSLRSESDGVADNHYDLGTHRCIAQCQYPAHFSGRDTVQGFHISYNYPLRYGFSIEPRLFAFKAQQTVIVTNWREDDNPANPMAPATRYVRSAQWQLSPAIGLGWQRGNCGAMGRLYTDLQGKGRWMGTLHEGFAITVTARCMFHPF